ncbi:hypothetical protein PR048_005105 [Dryococelus australis]|uniref:Uncharacterized protein n=1 Tax=Dryococelus australis TaxID=614101 RepID=A0ABQ9I8B1_9NEOP|nr:hypothetical protein PR048_005105 [Dryococelus australis]
MDAFEKYYIPKLNASVVRHYVTELKFLITDCEFGDMRDSLIKDKIISGISDEKVKNELLNTDSLTCEKAISICKMAELIEI